MMHSGDVILDRYELGDLLGVGGRTAQHQAAIVGSTLGCTRAEQLWRRLACSDPLVRTW